MRTKNGRFDAKGENREEWNVRGNKRQRKKENKRKEYAEARATARRSRRSVGAPVRVILPVKATTTFNYYEK